MHYIIWNVWSQVLLYNVITMLYTRLTMCTLPLESITHPCAWQMRALLAIVLRLIFNSNPNTNPIPNHNSNLNPNTTKH